MAVIQVLDQSVAELIAAGEVVERPASIAKELLENSIDAGATSITVEIEEGGVRLLRVRDNGIGIGREDVPRAFLRHATSKIRDARDLDSILTLGFRGEALASIAAVAKVELTTKTAEETEGTALHIEGGGTREIAPAGCPTGTTISVRDVFYNTPARMKFLKKNMSEGSAVAQVVDKLALSHPEIAFRFIRDGQTKLQTSGGGELLAVIQAIYGRELAQSMIPVAYVYENAIGVNGYISHPSGVKPSRTYQNFFINGRFVRTRTAAAALEEAYKGKIMSGRFPACVLNLELDAATVDVNVHPAKTEVRFAQEKPVFSAVYFGVKTALAKLEQPVIPTMAAQAGSAADPAPAPWEHERKAAPYAAPSQPPQRISAQEFRVLFAGQPDREQPAFGKPLPLHASGSAKKLDIYVEEEPREEAIFRPASVFDKKDADISGTIISGTAANTEKNDTIITEAPAQTVLEKEPACKLVGELFGTYILLQRGDTMVLVYKHAAHERMLYERLKENIAYGNRQLLLSPQAVVLPREDCAALLEELSTVEQLGFLVEDFGDGTVLVREIPIELGERDVSFIIAEIADKLKANRQDLTPAVLDRLYYSIACKSAVRAGDRNNLPELREIVEQLGKNPQITHCPHGRPVSVEITRNEIEKLFGRQG